MEKINLNIFKKHPIIGVLTTAVLLSLAWPPLHYNVIILFAFVPMLLASEGLLNKGAKVKHGLHIYLGLVVWNIATTWWVWYSTKGGAVSMIILNTLMFILPWWLYKLGQKYLPKQAFLILVSSWMALEYLHLEWQISFPWLNLGNAFATNSYLVQWYEYTGTSGGTLWIWLCNIGFYLFIKNRRKITLFKTIALVILPMFFSLFLYYNYTEKGEKIEVACLQPNIDPYFKFEFNIQESTKQIESFLAQAEAKITDKTKLLLLPETAITYGIDEDEFKYDPRVQLFTDFVKKHNNLSVITGAESQKVYYVKDKKKPTHTSKTTHDPNVFYDNFNTALFLQNKKLDTYHKLKLVPAVEIMPYPQFLGFLQYFAIDLGGSFGNLGRYPAAKNFEDNEGRKYTPSICYETIYGGFNADQVKRGSQLLCIITNDAWWKNTAGHIQLLEYAKLRAIENRRDIARSANTGISATINQKGQITKQTQWWKKDVLVAEVQLNKELTFYTKHGDILYRLASFFIALLLAGLLTKKILNGKLKT